ncbi:GntR family transcriptional regulator [Microbispora hainanensis]|uniref:GntR family transcriptional regulator n=1 Tax=Microbispora hainanensis TaxID=568844 RepID=A0A544Y7Z2_9ACTN|nr:GntR family transcriptional regulator [Microbispora hainanensis]TQS12897.1 GntR family transcriptional regulator [Microbispora hainanensis]
MPRKSDERPPQLKIAADLRAKIMSGELEPGQKLPSTAELAETYGTAAATAHNATKLLQAEGFAYGQAGKGVFVRDRRPFVVRTAAYFDPAERGVTYRLLDVAEVDAPKHVAAELGEERAILRHRLMLRDEEPVEVSWSYYPHSLAADTALSRRGRIRGGAPAVLAELGHPEREFTDSVSVRPPTTGEAELLELPEGIPVIRQLRVVYSDEARPVEVSILIKGGHLYELRYQQTIPGEAS